MNLNIDFGSIIQRFSASGIKILIIVGAVIAAQMFLRRIVPKLLEFGEKRIGEKEVEFSKRMATLGSVIANAVAVILYMMAGLMILSELGIDIVPLLTGAGLLGLFLWKINIAKEM